MPTLPPAADPMLELPRHVQGIEEALQRLDDSLRGHDPLAIDTAAQALHKVLADAVVVCRHAQQAGQEALPIDLRRRLVLAQSRVGALQGAVHRAGASIERTLGILMPPSEGPATYGGLGPRPGSAAALSAAYR